MVDIANRLIEIGLTLVMWITLPMIAIYLIARYIINKSGS